METVFGITKRLYYFFAALLVLASVYTAGFKVYEWNRLKANPGWSFASDCNVPVNKLCLVVQNKEEKVFIEVDNTFNSLSEHEKTKKVNEAKILAFGNNKLNDTDFYWALFFIVAIFPIFRLIHLIAHWIIWGRIK